MTQLVRHVCLLRIIPGPTRTSCLPLAAARHVVAARARRRLEGKSKAPWQRGGARGRDHLEQQGFDPAAAVSAYLGLVPFLWILVGRIASEGKWQTC